jgi:hypothetical protein
MFDERDRYKGGGYPAVLPSALEIFGFGNLPSYKPYSRLLPIPEQQVRKPAEKAVEPIQKTSVVVTVKQ